MSIDLEKLTIKNAHEALLRKDFSVSELAGEYLSLISKKDDDLHAYAEVFDNVSQQALAAENIFQDKENVSPLTGIPLGIKDNILIKGEIASAGSKMLSNYFATYDAFAIERLRDQGAVFLGRTNMDEFAMGGSTETSAHGPTKNPHGESRVPGGSSGGSAAAVAGGLALGALGSDTGGSIRQPAAFCGVVGMKPTYGSVSRSGLMAMASSLDQIGPFAKTVTDAELLFESIRGEDPKDSTSLPTTNIPKKNEKDGKFTVGVPRAFLEKGVSKEVLENFEEALKKLNADGVEVRDISLPFVEYALATYYILMPAEASSNLARYDGVRYGLSIPGENVVDSYRKTRALGFGPEVRRRIMLGTYVLSAGYYDAYYNKAKLAQQKLRGDFDRAFEEVDAIVTPTTPAPAFKIGEKKNDPLEMYTQDIFTVPANIAGLPAISLPSGFAESAEESLPLGLQLTAAHLQESTLFALGKRFLGENDL